MNVSQAAITTPWGGKESVLWFGTPTETPAPPHKCPHRCGRDRHPEPLTRAVATMYDNHQFREDYDPDQDDSPIVCIGANYHGPKRPPSTYREFGFSNAGFIEGAKSPTWLMSMISTYEKLVAVSTAQWPTWKFTSDFTFILDEPFPNTPETLEPVDTEGIAITFDTAWKPWERATGAGPEHAAARKLTPHITAHANDFPIPPSPGYDFSKYATKETTPHWIGAHK